VANEQIEDGGPILVMCGDRMAAMSMRDLFSGMALIGLLGATVSDGTGKLSSVVHCDDSEGELFMNASCQEEGYAGLAYKLADAMLAARKIPPSGPWPFPADAMCFFRDGDNWCCVRPDFVNLQESPAGFGSTRESAAASLIEAELLAKGGAS
jgi:hypothetical protein